MPVIIFQLTIIKLFVILSSLYRLKCSNFVWWERKLISRGKHQYETNFTKWIKKNPKYLNSLLFYHLIGRGRQIVKDGFIYLSFE